MSLPAQWPAVHEKWQQMCWTKRGLHLLLQVRCALLNDELLPVFRGWRTEVGGHT
jgi:hypothetical protein